MPPPKQAIAKEIQTTNFNGMNPADRAQFLRDSFHYLLDTLIPQLYWKICACKATLPFHRRMISNVHHDRIVEQIEQPATKCSKVILTPSLDIYQGLQSCRFQLSCCVSCNARLYFGKAEAQVTNKQAKAKETHHEESTEPSNPNKKEATSLKQMGCGTCTSERIEENTEKSSSQLLVEVLRTGEIRHTS